MNIRAETLSDLKLEEAEGDEHTQDQGGGGARSNSTPQYDRQLDETKLHPSTSGLPPHPRRGERPRSEGQGAETRHDGASERAGRRSFDDVLLRSLLTQDDDEPHSPPATSWEPNPDDWKQLEVDPDLQWESLLSTVGDDVQRKRRRSVATLKKWGWTIPGQKEQKYRAEKRHDMHVETHEHEETGSPSAEQEQARTASPTKKSGKEEPSLSPSSSGNIQRASKRDSLQINRQRMGQHSKTKDATKTTPKSIETRLSKRKFHPFWLYFYDAEEETIFQEKFRATFLIITSTISAITVLAFLYTLLLLALVEGARITSIAILVVSVALAWCIVLALTLRWYPSHWHSGLWQLAISFMWLASATALTVVHSLICGEEMRPSDICSNEEECMEEDITAYCETFGESPLPAAFAIICFLTPWVLAVMLRVLWLPTVVIYVCVSLVTLIFAPVSGDGTIRPLVFFAVALAIYGLLAAGTLWLFEWHLRAHHRTERHMEFQVGSILAAKPEMEYAERLRQKLTAITEHIPYMLVEYGPDFSYSFVSPACTDILGYRPNELLDNPRLSGWNSIFHEDRERVLQGLSDGFLSPDKKVNVQFRRKGASGKYLWIHLEGKFLPLTALGRTKSVGKPTGEAPAGLPSGSLSEKELSMLNGVQKIFQRFVLVGIESNPPDTSLEQAVRKWKSSYNDVNHKLMHYRQLFDVTLSQLSSQIESLEKNLGTMEGIAEEKSRQLQASYRPVTWSLTDVRMYLAFLEESGEKQLKNNNPRVLVNFIVNEAHEEAKLRGRTFVNNLATKASHGKTQFPVHYELTKHCIWGCIEMALVYSASRDIIAGYRDTEEQLSFDFIFDTTYADFLDLKDRIQTLSRLSLQDPPPPDVNSMSQHVGIKLYVVMQFCKCFYGQISCQEKHIGTYTKMRLSMTLLKRPPRTLIRSAAEVSAEDIELRRDTQNPDLQLETVPESARSDSDASVTDAEEKWVLDEKLGKDSGSGHEGKMAWTPVRLSEARNKLPPVYPAYPSQGYRSSESPERQAAKSAASSPSGARSAMNVRRDFYRAPRDSPTSSGSKAVKASSRAELRKTLSRQIMSDYRLGAHEKPMEMNLPDATEKEEAEEEDVKQITDPHLNDLGLDVSAPVYSGTPKHVKQSSPKSSPKSGRQRPEETVTIFGKSFRRENKAFAFEEGSGKTSPQ
eukprot:gb/GECG01002951.1/.p1 GENE.gb/GECG01002951.1/~~gb/GECG01002951.1/.p1  ORF type:complete len:1183 (+),score=151.33 gb/GECG01002951.1/:1-3549(+)